MRSRWLQNVTCCGACLLLVCGCASSGKKTRSQHNTDTVISASSKRAGDAFTQGLFDVAAASYQEALNRARMLDKPEAAASSAYNLAACYAAMHEFKSARNYLVEARAEFLRVDDRSGAGETWLLDAKMAQAEKQLDVAEARCLKAIELLEESKRRSTMLAHAYVLMAYLNCEKNELRDAEEALLMARRADKGVRDPQLLPDLLVTEAYLNVSQHAQMRAALKYDAAAAAYRDLNRGREVAEMLSRAGNMYRADEEHALAGERFYRAARSYLAQGNVDLTLKRLKLAFESADYAEDVALTQKCAAFYSSIKKQVDLKPNRAEKEN
jgi:tetratricopeptide (TPR) repeat protein